MQVKVIEKKTSLGSRPASVQVDLSKILEEKWVEIKSRRFIDQWCERGHVMRSFRLKLTRELSILLREVAVSRGNLKVQAKVVYAHHPGTKVYLEDLNGNLQEIDWQSVYNSLCEKSPLSPSSVYSIPCGDWVDPELN